MQGELNVSSVAYARECHYKDISSIDFSLLESGFSTGPSNRVVRVISAFSNKDKALDFVAPENWCKIIIGLIENFADLSKKKLGK